MRRSRFSMMPCWIAVALVFAARANAAEASPGSAIRVEPKEIQVGMFYRGTKVHVEGTAPAGYKVALVCIGHEAKVDMKRKGKVAGVLWMNVGDVVFEHVPSLFLASSESGGTRRSDQSDHAGAIPFMGYDRVEARVLPASADEDMRKLFREFIRLKEHEQLYFSGNGPVRSGATSVSADFWLPASILPGEYEVRLLGEEGDTAAVLATEKMIVKRIGVAALISSMAQQHGLVYGVLAVLFAIAMGFLTGVLFKGSKKGH